MEIEQIYRTYFKSVYHYIWKLSGNEQIAEKIASETFLKVMKSIGEFRGDCDMRVWICQIAKNTYYTYLKKRHKTASMEEIELQNIADPKAFLEEQIGIQVEALQIRKILHTMPEPYKEVYVLPLYLENMVSEGTTVFVKEHLETCSDCAAAFERLKSGRQIDVAEAPQRKYDAEVITAVKKKIAKIILKAVAAVCLVFVVLLCAVLLYTGISYPVTKDNISLSTKKDGEYSYIILETEAGKALYFEAKTEDILVKMNRNIF